MTLWEYSYISINELRKRLGFRPTDEAFYSFLVFIMLEYIGWLDIILILHFLIIPYFGFVGINNLTGIIYILGLYLIPLIAFLLLYKRFTNLEKQYNHIGNRG